MQFFSPGYGGLFWLHDLIWALVVVAIVVGAVLVFRALARRPAGHVFGPPPGQWRPQSPALTELELRYARGEIERVEYLQRRADLLGGPTQAPSGPGTQSGPTSSATF